MSAAEHWQRQLAAWAIPEEILAQAPEDPWTLPVELFEADQRPGLTLSHRRALEALRDGDEVLDVGAGRCAMSLPLRPPAARIIAVDESRAMLANSPADVTVLGRWPDVVGEVTPAPVVVCGHVLYNVPDLGPFVSALSASGLRRVVVEITQAHPRTRALETVLWKHFWGITRPTGPTWEDAVSVMRDQGITPSVDLWNSGERWGFRKLEDLVAWMRRTVCLDRSRDQEVDAIVRQYAVQHDGRWQLSGAPRSIATIWWDVESR